MYAANAALWCFADLKEYKVILKAKGKIIPLMDETQPKSTEAWFEEPEPDDDSNQGVAVGTEVFNGKCVFLDKKGLCACRD